MTSAHSGASLTATQFVDKIDPFKKGSLKRKPKKSQGSSRYRSTNDVELQALPLLKEVPNLWLHVPLGVCEGPVGGMWTQGNIKD
ncbi:hypothetical protein AVEN_268615-1 [Araneus ventricosus]|uniref:Uncharacterized protein n=1 Tax=Araneus ventricosus TaxID=182803 RepID=A0A4Y2GYL0_ARAVE|nr:hypothetical protein AVEN_268615-1 [Araneus ventricosus]